MKILQVIPAFPPSTGYGGAPIVACEISKVLANNGHEITVFATDAFDEHQRMNSKIIKNYNFKVYYFKNLSNKLAHRYRLYLAPSFIIEGANTKNFDIVHLHDFRSFPIVVIYLFCKFYNVPYLLQPHGKPSKKMTQRGRLFKCLFDYLIGNRIIKDAARILVLNYDEAKIYSEISKDNISLINNGINKSDYILPNKYNFKKKFGIPLDYKIILYVGRISEAKGLDMLVESFAKLCQKKDKILLVFIGPDDGYLEYLKNLSESKQIVEKVIFAGFLEHNDKLSAYIDADVFATPIFYGFPLTFLEAMICGTPIITTNAGDRLPWIDGEIGIIADHDICSIEQAFISILSRETNTEKKYDNVSQKINEYSWESIVKSLEIIYLQSKR